MSSSRSDEPSVDCDEINSVVNAYEKCYDDDRHGCHDRDNKVRVTDLKKKIYCVPDDHCRKPTWHESFASTITPLSNLVSMSGLQGAVEFLMRRKNKVVTLQWEPFTGNLAANGAAYLNVPQDFANLPPYPVRFAYSFTYKSVDRASFIRIVPDDKNGHIRFYLNTDGSGTGIQMGDAISFDGGCISWEVRD